MSTRPRRRGRSACPSSRSARSGVTPPAHPAHLPADASLERLLAGIDGALADGCEHPAMLVGVVIDAAGVEVALAALEAGEHPVDALIGFSAPDEWAAVGVVAVGTATAIDAGASMASRRVRVLHLLDRTGSEASLLHDLDEDTALPCPSPADGHIADLCRRMLGLPTAPPPPSVLPWWTAVWLDRILAESLADPAEPWTWHRLALLHPAVDPNVPPLDPEGLAEEAVATAASVSWGTVRQQASDELAGWMDDGMFARWVLSQHLGARQLAAELTSALDAGAAVAVLDTLAALDTHDVAATSDGEAW